MLRRMTSASRKIRRIMANDAGGCLPSVELLDKGTRAKAQLHVQLYSPSLICRQL